MNELKITRSGLTKLWLLSFTREIQILHNVKNFVLLEQNIWKCSLRKLWVKNAFAGREKRVLQTRSLWLR